MVYREFLLWLRKEHSLFTWHLGPNREIRGRHGAGFHTLLSAFTFIHTGQHLSHAHHWAEAARRLDLHPEMAFRVYAAAERLTPYDPHICDELLDAVGLRDFAGWGPPFDNGAQTRPEDTRCL